MFRRLDLTGDGKLTYLNLRSSLELLQEGTASRTRIDDIMIRSWLRENDRGSKGYVDFDDFLQIFDSVGQPHNFAGQKSAAMVESGRIDRIRRTFAKYDVDGDGLIDVEDLISVFRATGKTVEIDEIKEWVRSRDSKGLGAVCFEDFLSHYA